MSLLELLKDAYSAQKNYQDKNFISYNSARQIVTEDRVDEWSKDHPLCLEHGHECPQKISLIHAIARTNRFVFIVLVFAELEFLIKKLIASKSHDMMLFDATDFEHICDSAGLSAEQKQGLVKCRSYVGVIFANDGPQDVPRDAVLPFLKRESLDRYGSYGVLYRVTIPGQHLRDDDDTVRYLFGRFAQGVLIIFRLSLLKNAFGQGVKLTRVIGKGCFARLRRSENGDNILILFLY